jgi:hypothetical protein
MIPTNQHRKLVPFWDKQLDDLRKKDTAQRLDEIYPTSSVSSAPSALAFVPNAVNGTPH